MARGRKNKKTEGRKSGGPVAEDAKGSPQESSEEPPISRAGPAGMEDNTAEVESPIESGIAQENQELLTFRLSDEVYAIDILKVEEIIRLIDVTPIPRAPKLVKGVISLRGAIIPIIELKRRMGLKETTVGKKNRIIITGLDQGLMGFVSDEVLEVVKVNKNEIESSPNLPGRGDSDHLQGVIRAKNRMIILLDIDRAANLG
jgi:purine-binding chemotaxis protein CheW